MLSPPQSCLGLGQSCEAIVYMVNTDIIPALKEDDKRQMQHRQSAIRHLVVGASIDNPRTVGQCPLMPPISTGLVLCFAVDIPRSETFGERRSLAEPRDARGHHLPKGPCLPGGGMCVSAFCIAIYDRDRDLPYVTCGSCTSSRILGLCDRIVCNGTVGSGRISCISRRTWFGCYNWDFQRYKPSVLSPFL